MLASDDCYRLIIKPSRKTRNLSQNAMVHIWFGIISNYLTKSVNSFPSPDWDEDAIMHTWLGYEATERVDVVTGEVTSVQSLRHASQLEKCTSSCAKSRRGR